MRVYAILFSSLLLLSLAVPCFAQEEAKPEHIVGKMAYKFTSGITNVATSIAEVPKQSYLSVRDDGAVGYVIGPLKGLGMTLYRSFIGTVETVFFFIPQPGYYDPAIDPDFVWKGWEKPHLEEGAPAAVGAPEPITDDMGD